ncbi:centromere/kinetochore protein zw10-like isoform X2 [Musca autumnalis]
MKEILFMFLLITNGVVETERVKMVTTIAELCKEDLNGISSAEGTKTSIVRILEQIRRFQDRIRKHIEDNYVDFIPNHTTSDVYIDEGESLLRETEHLLKNVESDARLALNSANVELTQCLEELREVAMGLKLSYRLLKIDQYFQCLEEANATKDYLEALNLLGKLKSLICCESSSDVDILFQKCDCYDTIKVRYHIQANILQQNLQQKFENLVKFSEKTFPSAKSVNLQVSKDVSQLQDTVLALFEARYNPMKLCDFLLENCIVPIITKPVSVDYSTEKDDYFQINISYSVKAANISLRPPYKQVFTHIKSHFECLENINIKVSANRYVFSIIGSHIRDKFMKLLIEECLMHSIPETMDEYRESTLLDDLQLFQQMLKDIYFLDSHKNNEFTAFSAKFNIIFQERFSVKIMESARGIMQKDLQDMITISDGNTGDEVKNNILLFPQCMISKGTLELTKLMERILRQPSNPCREINESDNEPNLFLSIISTILTTYCSDVPKIYDKLLESIPQQSALFYNNCMFLAHWVTKNADVGIPAHPVLVKTLQSTGLRIFKAQEDTQRSIVLDIMNNLDISDTHSIGPIPLKLVRQCLRQMELLKNVWLNVLPESVYNKSFGSILNEFFQYIIRRILTLEDISATVASELSELINVTLEKAPDLFKEKHEVLQISSWMKLQQLQMILNASLQEIIDQWCDGAGILTANYKAEELRHLIRALFQNTDRRAKALSRIV